MEKMFYDLFDDFQLYSGLEKANISARPDYSVKWSKKGEDYETIFSTPGIAKMTKATLSSDGSALTVVGKNNPDFSLEVDFSKTLKLPKDFSIAKIMVTTDCGLTKVILKGVVAKPVEVVIV